MPPPKCCGNFLSIPVINKGNSSLSQVTVRQAPADDRHRAWTSRTVERQGLAEESGEGLGGEDQGERLHLPRADPRREDPGPSGQGRRGQTHPHPGEAGRPFKRTPLRRARSGSCPPGSKSFMCKRNPLFHSCSQFFLSETCYC